MDHYRLEEAKEYKERLSIALKAAKICVFEVDLTRQLYTFFENAEDIFGVSGEVILNDVRSYSKLAPADYQKAVSEYFSHPDDEKTIDKAFQSIFSGQSTTYEARMRAGGSDYLWCKVDVTPVIENRVPVKMIGVITDISNLKSRTDQLENEIKHDNFTGLYNKKYTIELIENVLKKYPEQKNALVLLDIDHFKNFNDTYGHALGDEAIQLVAGTLKRSFRRTDVVGRFGGDEFIVFITNIPNGKWLADKLRGLLRFESGRISYTASIGAAIFPEDADNFNSLFLKADEALYQAKLQRETYAFFSDLTLKG